MSLLSSLITMQNLVTVSHAVIHVRGFKNVGDAVARPRGMEAWLTL